MNHQPGVKGVVRESVAQGINQALECPMIASYDYLTILGGDINEKIGWAYHSLHSRLMIHRITIKLQLPGKSRLISNSISSSAQVVRDWYEILEQS